MSKLNLFLAVLLALAGNSVFARQDEPITEFEHSCPKDAEGKLVIHHIAVGQGDATFIRTPKGRTILIDAGLPSRGEDDIVPTLEKCYNIQNIDYFVLTHFDQDHHGGMYEVLEALPPRFAIYDPGEAMNTKNAGPGSAYKRYADAARKTGRRRVPMLGTGSFRMPYKDPVVVEMVAMNGKVLDRANPFKPKQVDIFKADGKPKEDNAISIALKISLGDFDYFIGGDLTGGGKGTPDVETPTADVVGDVDVLHANHHGSETSSNEYFLGKLSPENVVISVGEDGVNKAMYFLPTASALARMDMTGSIRQVFQTSEGATVLGGTSESILRKVVNVRRDIIIVAEKDSYTLNGTKYDTDRSTPPPTSP